MNLQELGIVFLGCLSVCAYAYVNKDNLEEEFKELEKSYSNFDSKTFMKKVENFKF